MRTVKLSTLLAGALVLSGGAALAEGPVLVIEKPGGVGPAFPYTLSWGIDPALPGAFAYDVIMGDLPTLITPAAPGVPGDFSAAVTACLLEDGPLPPPALALAPPPLGGQSFYLVKAQAGPVFCGPGSWNEAFVVAPFSQLENRDIEIPLDPASCPCP
jgi:hypothetical protein